MRILALNSILPFGLKHTGYQPIQQVIILPTDPIDGARTSIVAKAAIGGDFGLIENSPITTGSATYNYKYQGQERQEELGLNWDSFKWRNYDPAIGRFFNVDPLTEKYVDWAPYVFSGNRVVDSRELEGLEPVEVGKDYETLVIVTNGRTARSDKDVVTKNKTLISSLPSPFNKGDDGLSLIGKGDYSIPGAKVINYAGSDNGVTAQDIAETIKGFRVNNPNGEVIMIGHSLGAKDNLKAANLIGENKINLMINLEAAQREGGFLGSSYSQNVKNVENLINFDSFSSDKKGGGGIGGQNSTRITLPKGTNHTNMDNSLLSIITSTVNIRNVFNPVGFINMFNFNNIQVKKNDDGGSSQY